MELENIELRIKYHNSWMNLEMKSIVEEKFDYNIL
jgi:hypothetical protein